MSDQELLDLLQIEARVLLQPLVALFDVWNQHAIMSTTASKCRPFPNARMQCYLINHLIERFFLARLVIVFIVTAGLHTAPTARVIVRLMVLLRARFLLIGSRLIIGCLTLFLAAVNVARRPSRTVRARPRTMFSLEWVALNDQV